MMIKALDAFVLVVMAGWERRLETQIALSGYLGVSPASLTRSLSRLDRTRLIVKSRLTVVRPHAREFLVHAVKYCFPVQVGARGRGIPTAHSAPPLNTEIASDEALVWPFESGTTVGASVVPIDARIPGFCVAQPDFHPVFAALDAIRIARPRETEIASTFISRWLEHV